MTYKEIIETAKDCMGFCKACIICNGKVCKNSMPGPGAKGIGDVAIRNYDTWREIRLNMDTICSNEDVDTSSLSAVQNNPVIKVWNKFLQDSSTCTMTANQPLGPQ